MDLTKPHPQQGTVRVTSALVFVMAGAAMARSLPLFRAMEARLDFVHHHGISGRTYFSKMIGPGATLVHMGGHCDFHECLVQGHDLGVGTDKVGDVYRDRLFHNDTTPGPHGTPRLCFVDITEESDLAARGNGTSVATDESDNDGRVDLTNLATAGRAAALGSIPPGGCAPSRTPRFVTRPGFWNWLNPCSVPSLCSSTPNSSLKATPRLASAVRPSASTARLSNGCHPTLARRCGGGARGGRTAGGGGGLGVPRSANATG